VIEVPPTDRMYLEAALVPSSRRSSSSFGGMLPDAKFQRMEERMRKQLVTSAAVAGMSVLGGLAIFSGSAGARSSTTTLHFFEKSITQNLTTASGQPVSAQTAPVVGDHADITMLDYVGNHSHHAKNWTATSHVFCTVTAVTAQGPSFTCDGEYAIAGSMIYANNFSVNGAAPSNVVQISGGTGYLQGASGTVTSQSYSANSNNSDTTLVIHKG
jgi:hypothetical protein